MSGYNLPFPKPTNPNQIYATSEHGSLSPIGPGIRQDPGQGRIVTFTDTNANSYTAPAGSGVGIAGAEIDLLSKYEDGFLYYIQITVDNENVQVRFQTGKLQGGFVSVANLRSLGNTTSIIPNQWCLTNDDPAAGVFTLSLICSSPEAYLQRFRLSLQATTNVAVNVNQFHCKRLQLDTRSA
jgi:hypothetical protein